MPHLHHLSLSSKGGGSWICDCDKIQKTDRELHAHEFDILTTIRDGPINTGQEDGRVGGSVVSKACVPLVLWKLRME